MAILIKTKRELKEFVGYLIAVDPDSYENKEVEDVGSLDNDKTVKVLKAKLPLFQASFEDKAFTELMDLVEHAFDLFDKGEVLEGKKSLIDL